MKLEMWGWGGDLRYRSSAGVGGGGGGGEIGVTKKEPEAGKWAAEMEKHQENISTTERKNS